MKMQSARFDSAVRLLKTVMKASVSIQPADVFSGWSGLAKCSKQVRAQGLALGLLRQHFVSPSSAGACVTTWASELWKQRLLALQRKIGLQMMNKIRYRLLMLYAQECVKLWDKRHNNDILRKIAGLNAMDRILKVK